MHAALGLWSTMHGLAILLVEGQLGRYDRPVDAAKMGKVVAQSSSKVSCVKGSRFRDRKASDRTGGHEPQPQVGKARMSRHSLPSPARAKGAACIGLLLAGLSVSASTWGLGCANSGDDDGEGPGGNDGGPGQGLDGAAPLDAAPLDGTAPSDAGTHLDSGSPFDASDAHSTGVADSGAESGADAISPVAPMGLTWPDGQAFPTFAPPAATLDVVDETGLARDSGVCDMCTLVVTLQGLVNRTQPRIWVTDRSSQQALWLAQIGAGTNDVADPMTLVTKYRSEIAGIVIYDDRILDTLNLATTIAGVKGGIVASPALSSILTAAPYSLPVLDDLRTQAFTSAMAVYQYEYDNYASLTTHRLITGLEIGIPDHLRDYAVATKAMMVWLDTTNSQQQALMQQFLALLPPTSPYLGWWVDEPSGVSTASGAGVPVFAADWSMNLTVLGGTPRGSAASPPPPPPPLENKMYIAIFMSDGDNLQEDEGLIPLKWADSMRGNVPIGWTVDPALVDVAPVILRYYQTTATVNDALVSGPSGLGYTYPEAWPSATTFGTYTQLSNTYLNEANLDVITLWNNGVDLSAANAQSYANDMPNLVGATIQNDSVATQFVGGLPINALTVSYANTEQELESGLTGAIAAYDGSKPCFAAIQGDMNYSTIMPSNFLDVRNNYATNSNIVFVRADHYFELMRRANAPPQHLVYTGDVNGDGKTDAFFYYAGNGDEWIGLSNGTTLSWSNGGNISGFGNVADGSHQLFTGDFTGDGKMDFAFYYNGDQSFWLGTSTGTGFTWGNISTTSIGNWLDGAHRVHVADYNGDGKVDVSVYDESDGDVWFGITTVSASGTTLTWDNASSVGGFGDLLDGSHAFLDGDFNGDGKQDVGFYYNGDGNVWLGISNGTTLSWQNAGSLSANGNVIDYDHRLVTGDFNGDGATDLAFYSATNGNISIGLSNKGSGAPSFAWATASTTAKNLIDWNHRLYNADVNGDGKLDFVSYDAATGAWTYGISSGAALTWSSAGSTSSAGDLVDYAHLLWFGHFNGSADEAPLFYDSASGNFSIGTSTGSALTFAAAGNTSGFGNLAQ